LSSALSFEELLENFKQTFLTIGKQVSKQISKQVSKPKLLSATTDCDCINWHLHNDDAIHH